MSGTSWCCRSRSGAGLQVSKFSAPGLSMGYQFCSGFLRGKGGWFPSNFAVPTSEEPEGGIQAAIPDPVFPELKAARSKASFSGDRPNLLSFERGDVVIVLKFNPKGWSLGVIFKGKDAKWGHFPGNFVELIEMPEDMQRQINLLKELHQKRLTTLKAALLQKKPESRESTSKFVIAKFPFRARSEKELSMSKGDVIKLTKEDPRGWSSGELKGKSGFFPRSYTEAYEPEKLGLTGEAAAVVSREEALQLPQALLDSSNIPDLPSDVSPENADNEPSASESSQNRSDNDQPLDSELPQLPPDRDKSPLPHDSKAASVSHFSMFFLNVCACVVVKRDFVSFSGHIKMTLYHFNFLRR